MTLFLSSYGQSEVYRSVAQCVRTPLPSVRVIRQGSA